MQVLDCSCLIKGWKEKSKPARVFTAGNRTGHIAVGKRQLTAKRDFGAEAPL